MFPGKYFSPFKKSPPPLVPLPVFIQWCVRIRGDLGNFYNVGLYEIFAKDVLISTVASSPFACETPPKIQLISGRCVYSNHPQDNGGCVH